MFNTPPVRQEKRLGLIIVALGFVGLAAAFPVRNVEVGTIIGLVLASNTVMLVCELITAAILYTQASLFRSRALTMLASGYLVGALLIIPWSLTYPGAFSANGLLGAKINTTGWLGISWRLSTPVAVTLYALLKQIDSSMDSIAERPPARILIGVLSSIAISATVTLSATLGHDWLPSFFSSRTEVIWSTLAVANAVVILWTLAAIVLLLRQEKSILDTWLLVAMSAWLAQALLNEFLHSRLSFGMYALLGLVLVSDLVVALALITESTRLYARLALSTAARDREREARLSSMDAVASAIAHEVGQSLTATKLSSSAALASLTKAEPRNDKVIGLLRESLESNERTFEVIKSIRATFAGKAIVSSEFSLNDLVRETASSLDSELAAHRVSLRLSLDGTLSSVAAHRIQIQRVLINLLTNAIEAVVEQPVRGRRITIRTAQLDSLHVGLEVIDTGRGILPDKMAQIFEPFFTTKQSGTGLGLALSSKIIEEHGGRLWASSSEGAGTTFHVELKCVPDSQQCEAVPAQAPILGRSRRWWRLVQAAVPEVRAGEAAQQESLSG